MAVLTNMWVFLAMMLFFPVAMVIYLAVGASLMASVAGVRTISAKVSFLVLPFGTVLSHVPHLVLARRRRQFLLLLGCAVIWISYFGALAFAY